MEFDQTLKASEGYLAISTVKKFQILMSTVHLTL